MIGSNYQIVGSRFLGVIRVGFIIADDQIPQTIDSRRVPVAVSRRGALPTANLEVCSLEANDIFACIDREVVFESRPEGQLTGRPDGGLNRIAVLLLPAFGAESNRSPILGCPVLAELCTKLESLGRKCDEKAKQRKGSAWLLG